MKKFDFKGRVGEMRPSQLMFSYGVGASVDLPHLTVLVMGLDDWPLSQMGAHEITEERLRIAVREAMNSPIERLLMPPPREDDGAPGLNNPSDKVGVPVAPFPRWMRCPMCNYLGRVDGGLFELKTHPFRLDYAKYVHINCPRSFKKPATALPARFLMACENGHLDDFPWMDYVHGGAPCVQSKGAATLRLTEVGTAGDAASIYVICEGCSIQINMSHAFEESFGDKSKKGGFQCSCRGRHPHLRNFVEGCESPVKTILLGASNSWFPITLSAFSIPVASDALGQLVEENWADLSDMESLSMLARDRRRGLLNSFAEFTDEEILAAIEAKRSGGESGDLDILDLKTPEWATFSNPQGAKQSDDFKLREVDAPVGFEAFFERVVLVERLREVHALMGFTRIDSPNDWGEVGEIPGERWVPLSRQQTNWVPSVQVRGEGIFLQLKESEVQKWCRLPKVLAYDKMWQAANINWRRSRGLEAPDIVSTPLWTRYVLLHSLSHALMRQVCLESGYSSASVRERIYWQEGVDGKEPMAGILIYTAAPDSEGTLGGLVGLGDPETLGHHLRAAMQEVAICASDPICSEHKPSAQSIDLHGCSCHACLFAPETSCERGNKFVDRAVLTPTFDSVIPPFFPFNN